MSARAGASGRVAKNPRRARFHATAGREPRLQGMSETKQKQISVAKVSVLGAVVGALASVTLAQKVVQGVDSSESQTWMAVGLGAVLGAVIAGVITALARRAARQ
jgi:uncharacterized membrane protein